MNWDIAIGHCKRMVGRRLQAWGRRTHRSKMVLDGEAIEYAGGLQFRYGVLKHQVQWDSALIRIHRRPDVGRADKGRHT